MSDRKSRAPPLALPPGPCWELQEGKVDSRVFLRALPSAFPEATDAYFEGSSIATDVAWIFERHAYVGPYLPQPQTIWSTGRNMRLRCRFTASLCEALAVASEHHAEVELFDHMFLYADRQVLLEWPDSFSNCIWLSPTLDEQRVRAFAKQCGLGYKHWSPGA